MSLVPSLLHAIIRVEGQALVMHVGDKPYVVTKNGQVDLATRGLTLEAVTGILAQVFPPESHRALDEVGAAQHELSGDPELPGELFTVVAARGGDDIWVEIRRKKKLHTPTVPSGVGATPEPAIVVARAEDTAPPEPPPDEAASAPVVPHTPPLPDIAVIVDAAGTPAASTPVAKAPTNRDVVVQATFSATAAPAGPQADVAALASAAPDDGEEAESWETIDASVLSEPVLEAPPRPVLPGPGLSAVTVSGADTHMKRIAPMTDAASPDAPADIRVHSVEIRHLDALPRMVPVDQARGEAPESAITGVVVPMVPVAPPPAPVTPVASVVPRALHIAEATAHVEPSSDLMRLLRVAAGRGASTVYLSSGLMPSMRLEGDIQPIEGAATLEPGEVESMLASLAPEANDEALRSGAASGWTCDLSGLGRVRCMAVRDQRGPGVVVRFMSVRRIGDQSGLASDLRSLAYEAEGLVLVAASRSSGRRALTAAIVDLINRTRRDHVISIEHEIDVVHEPHLSLISQREVRGGDAGAAARAALREDPDVIVLQDMHDPLLVSAALDAAESGQLVIGGLSARDATDAVGRLVDTLPPEERRRAKVVLGRSLRGIVAEVMLRRIGGGRLLARDVLLASPAVAHVLMDGSLSELRAVLESGRSHGMSPLNDSLAGYVRAGVVDPREAYRCSPDRPGLLDLLERQGIDRSFVERRA